MRRSAAAAGSAVFFLLAPGTVAGLVPWLLTDWRANPGWLPLRLLGVLLVLAGAGVLLHAFGRFVVEGLGTPAPVAPPERLVAGGLYRHVRNPMYLALVVCVAGQGLILAAPVLFGYAAAVLAVTMAFVRWYEEPVLRRRYGEAYEAYRRAVPGWLPRLRPWRPPDVPTTAPPGPGRRR